MNMSEVYKRYLDIALLLSEHSCCIRRHYGAIIVSAGFTIVSAGFNDVVDDARCDSVGYCLREKLNIPKGERYEMCKANHAEQQALINADPIKMVGGTIFIAGRNVVDNTIADSSPCLICRRMLKFAKLQQAVYAMPDKENPHNYTVNIMCLNDGVLTF